MVLKKQTFFEPTSPHILEESEAKLLIILLSSKLTVQGRESGPRRSPVSSDQMAR